MVDYLQHITEGIDSVKRILTNQYEKNKTVKLCKGYD